jgi:hypothetical protein
MDQILFEVDYPHSATTYPDTAAVVTQMCDWAGLDVGERHQLVRGNAVRAYGLERFGITA